MKIVVYSLLSVQIVKKKILSFFAHGAGRIDGLSKINMTGYSLNIEECPKPTKTKVSEYLL